LVPAGSGTRPVRHFHIQPEQRYLGINFAQFINKYDKSDIVQSRKQGSRACGPTPGGFPGQTARGQGEMDRAQTATSITLGIS
jgi:hypothetical protein